MLGFSNANANANSNAFEFAIESKGDFFFNGVSWHFVTLTMQASCAKRAR